MLIKNQNIIDNTDEYLHSPKYTQYISFGIFGLYSRKCYEGVRFNEEIFYNEEGPFIIRLNLRAKSLGHLHMPLYYYCSDNNNSVSRSEFSEKMMTVILSYEEEINIFGQQKLKGKEKILHRQFLTYFDCCFRAENTNKYNEFFKYRYIFEKNYNLYIKNKEMSFIERMLCVFYHHSIPGWRKLHGKVEMKRNK